ncbi:MAG: deaminase, partial [Shewanella sp.]
MEQTDEELQAWQDKQWMQVALSEAAKAEAAGEVPVGAVLVKDGKQIATGYNLS